MSVLWYKKAHQNLKGIVMEIVLATRNKKKVEEIKRITEGMAVTIFTLDDFPGCPEVEEDGATFEENAVKKAVTVARFTGKPALADDSGLEVYALSGAPGTLSARYAGDDADDSKNTEKLLSEMRLHAKKDRKADLSAVWPWQCLTEMFVHFMVIAKEASAPSREESMGLDTIRCFILKAMTGHLLK